MCTVVAITALRDIYDFTTRKSLHVFTRTGSKQFITLMGDFEIFILTISTFLLSVVIYNILNSFMFRKLMQRFGTFKIARRDFYECGFRPMTQKPLRLPIPFLLICIFFLLYDIELIYLFPLVSCGTGFELTDILLLVLFALILFVSLAVDFIKHSLQWQY